MKSNKTKFLWLTDPWEWLDRPRDTTLRLAEESIKLGFENYWANVKTIRLVENSKAAGSTVVLDAHRLVLQGATVEREGAEEMSPLDFTSLQYRMDPPVDATYYHPLQLLTLGFTSSAKGRAKRAPELVNRADVLFSANEKLEAARLGSLSPRSVVTSRQTVLEGFLAEEGQAVLKPLDQCQSKGVELLKWNTAAEKSASSALLVAATHDFKRPVVLQRFLPGIAQGEQRLWFLDGRLLANAKKYPIAGDFRVNIDRGSALRAEPLSTVEKRAALKIGAYLRARKIRLAAVDLIDGQITDFNFTSPGLLRQMEDVTGKNLARPIIKALARPLR